MVFKTAGQAVGAQNKRTLDFTKLDDILGHPAYLNAGQDSCKLSCLVLSRHCLQAEHKIASTFKIIKDQ